VYNFPSGNRPHHSSALPTQGAPGPLVLRMAEEQYWAQPDARESWQALVELAQARVGATGAAIVVRSDCGGLWCKVSCGAAPAVGTRLDPQSGLTGLCFHLGLSLLCRDTDSEPKVDAVARSHKST